MAEGFYLFLAELLTWAIMLFVAFCISAYFLGWLEPNFEGAIWKIWN